MLNIFKRKYLYYILQFTWGIFTNILGLLLFLICKFILRWKCYKFYKNIVIYPTKRKLNAGISLGIFIFADKDSSLLEHEYGHSIQNLIFGPLFLLVIGIPSFVRSLYFTFVINKLNLRPGVNGYYNIWFEADASALGRHTLYNKKWDWLI